MMKMMMAGWGKDKNNGKNSTESSYENDSTMVSAGKLVAVVSIISSVATIIVIKYNVYGYTSLDFYSLHFYCIQWLQQNLTILNLYYV